MTHSKPCNLCQDFFDGELTRELERVFRDHLLTCSDCRENLLRLEMFRKRLGEAVSASLPDDAELRIRNAIHKELDFRQSTEDVLDMEAAAGLLSISVQDIVQIMDQLPCFEIAGKIRFRKSEVLKWAAGREDQMKMDRLKSQKKSRDKFIIFPGGSL